MDDWDVPGGFKVGDEALRGVMTRDLEKKDRRRGNKVF